MAHLFASAIDADRCDTECIRPERVRPLLGRSLSPDGAVAVGELFGIVADPSRARILHLLAIADDLCVCDIALVLGMSVSALSHQLHYLRERGAVERRKVGRIAYYRLVDDHLRHLVVDGVAHAAELSATGTVTGEAAPDIATDIARCAPSVADHDPGLRTGRLPSDATLLPATRPSHRHRWSRPDV